ncbi:3-isopropylmalate/(R)-2-methylmalate dehydratase large subunit [Devosia enhydra]|uniref:3-isopropylmalate/(R)-2-methylmalate dehydratase large subunit n=1 Tax=Devosia enhydra TaxID=665118 RepID=A0A1K2I0W1_9HYPH|nr:aconitase/3-isopropylmalate dehydratase large subunit family protein [Devosia enhydra]SFZ85420.1 3-isopropylmalate/(R)-2-methylmalate dehydratase large subunit [Devosia enhydra]
MGYTATEKIIARACGRAAVRPGEVVYPSPDQVIVHDGYIANSRQTLDELGITEVFDRDRVLLVVDHAVTYSNLIQAERGAAIRRAVKHWGVRDFYDAGRGGQGHVLPMEQGYVLPGDFVFANDMHSSNNGAVGALAMRTGTEIICVLATGTMWIEVPRTILVTLDGRLQPGVFPRDIGFKVARDFTNGTYGCDWDYRVIEFAGEAIDRMSVDERVPLCNTLTEIGTATAFFAPSPAIVAEARIVARRPFEPVYSDPDAEYEARLTLDLDSLAPQVSLPGSPDNAVDIATVVGQPVDHAQIGSCGSSMYEDMEVAGHVLRGRKVSPGTRLYVTPGTVDITKRMTASGLMQVFQDAGAMILPPGCGPCAGGQMAQLAAGEVSLSTGATNGRGRMGSPESSIYLASPATVALSAITGRITDPRSEKQLWA